jgi:2'-hydroxyisoflavone reductase
LNLLILGGTIFLGRHLVDSALARGHQVTLFNRGQHNPDLFPEVEKLRGDRKTDLSALEGRRWDAVIDTCGYVPRVVRASAELLAPNVGLYAFISSISVYASVSEPGTDEAAPVGTLEDPTVEEVTGETYGPLKALCEQAAEAALPERALIIRPGLIVGPHDPTDRFTWWPRRIAQGSDIVAPEPRDAPIQIIDGRDLAEWTIALVERGRTGVYNATGPEYRLTMERTLETCRAASGSDARFVWMDESFLLERGVGPWMELPLWIPSSDESANLSAVNIARALADGLTFRPLAETIRDTLAWDATRPVEAGDSHTRGVGLSPEREAELLRAWRERAS